MPSTIPAWTDDDLRHWLASTLPEVTFADRRVLLIVPDPASPLPLPRLFAALFEVLRPMVQVLDVVAAVGDQPPLSEQQFCRWLGIHEHERLRLFYQTQFFNHDWDRPDSLETLGEFSETEVQELTGGQLDLRMPVSINSLIRNYDELLVLDAVTPQAGTGFSGGHSTLLAGLGGPGLISVLDWLSFVNRSPSQIENSVVAERKLLEAAAKYLPSSIWSISCVPHPDEVGEIGSLHFGTQGDSWQAAVPNAAQWHVRTVATSASRVVANLPDRFRDLWTAARSIPLLENLVAPDGELILLAPHISQLSISHRAIFDAVSLPGHPLADRRADDPPVAWQQLVRHFVRKKLGFSADPGMGESNLEQATSASRYRLSLAMDLSRKDQQRLAIPCLSPEDINASLDGDVIAGASMTIPHTGEDVYRLA